MWKSVLEENVTHVYTIVKNVDKTEFSLVDKYKWFQSFSQILSLYLYHKPYSTFKEYRWMNEMNICEEISLHTASQKFGELNLCFWY